MEKEKTQKRRKKITILIILILIITLTKTTMANQEEEISQLINDYYQKNMEENLKEYYETISQENNNEEKKEITKTLWELFNTKEYEIKNLKLIIGEEEATATYDLKATIQDQNLNEISYERKMIMLLTKEKNQKKYDGWRVIKVMPETSYLIKESTNLISINNQTIKEPKKIVTKKTIKNCELKEEEFYKEYNLTTNDLIRKFIGEGTIKLKTNNKEYYYELTKNQIKKSKEKEPDYEITINNCDLKELIKKPSLTEEYINQKKIIIKGEKTLTKTKSFIITSIIKIKNLFKKKEEKKEEKNQEKKEMSEKKSIIIKLDDATLNNKKKYSFIGPGRIYLGDKDSYITKKFKINKTKTYDIYIKTYDDQKQPAGSRNAIIIIDDKKINYEHQIHKGWQTEELTRMTLKKGEHNLKIIKPEQTSAAFIASELIIKE